MFRERWSIVKSVFEKAAAVPAALRAAWFHSENIPADMVDEVERLLGHASAGEKFETDWHDESADPPPDTPALARGMRLLNRFEILRFLGRGGMGEVYAATDHDLKQEVALKIVKPEYSNDPRWAAQLRREVQNARRLRHENICRIFDLHRSIDSGAAQTFVTMELLDGITLADEVRGGLIPLERAVKISAGIIAGLAAIHEAGIVHRDFKSSNVMLTDASSRAVIMDFGLSQTIAKPVLETLSQFGANALVGTPAYMAPEQLQGEHATVASDIHALGVILFEIATGELPFQGKTALAIALRRMGQEAPSPASLRPDLPPSWNATILRCLARDPKRRPPTVQEVFALLNSPPTPFLPNLSRRAVAITTTLVIGAAATASLWYSRPSARVPAADFHLRRGEEFARKLDLENTQAAIAEYQAAIREDPKNYDAYLGMARSYANAAHYALMDPKQARAAAEAAAMRCLQLKPDSGAAEGIRAFVLSTDFDHWREAEPMLKHAIKLDPSNSELRCRYAVYLGRIGRHHEAVQEARTAVTLNAGDYDANHQLVVELNRARDFEEALLQAKELVRLRSTEPEPYAALARANEWTGRFPDAEAALLESERYSRSERNRYTALAHRVTLLAAEGYPEKARSLVEQVYVYWKSNPFEANLLLSAYGKLGDKDRVAEILDVAYQQGDTTILAAYTNPYLASIRVDPKLLAIFRRLQFER